MKNQLLKISNKSSGLRSAVAEWLLEDYSSKDEAKARLSDLLQHGCASGIVSELIYYSDTVVFHDKHESEIWELADQQAEELGHKNAMEMFGSFNGAEAVGSGDQFKNLLAWYAFEETARQLASELNLNI